MKKKIKTFFQKWFQCKKSEQNSLVQEFIEKNPENFFHGNFRKVKKLEKKLHTIKEIVSHKKFSFFF